MTRQDRLEYLSLGLAISLSINEICFPGQRKEGVGSLRRQIWGQTRLLYVPFKETMTQISRTQGLAIIAMNHWWGKPQKASAWGPYNLHLFPSQNVTSLPGRWTAQSISTLRNSSSHVVFPFSPRMRYDDFSSHGEESTLRWTSKWDSRCGMPSQDSHVLWY